jgi:O-succinylbenzoate synthase
LISFSYFPYSLTPLGSLNANSKGEGNSGALFKISWNSEGANLTGYGDFHSWAQLGDASMKDQLKNIELGIKNPHFEQTIWLAHRDALARSQKRSLFQHPVQIQSNYLVSDADNFELAALGELKQAGFKTLKLKVGRNLKSEIALMNEAASVGLRLRLDFNASATLPLFLNYLNQLEPRILDQIEYIEDPFPFDLKDWQEARKFAKIALDNEYDKVPWADLTKAPCDVLILKPAKLNVQNTIEIASRWNLKVAVTNYMDHPVGTVHALSVAMDLKKQYGDMILDGGFLTQHLYKADLFSEQLTVRNSELIPAAGLGIGFDQLLETLPWLQIKSP